MTNYFKNMSKVSEIRKTYFILAKANHPDCGGNVETMKAINNAYETALKACEGIEQPVEGSERTYTYTFKQPEETELMSVLSNTLAAKMPGVVIALMGSWLWLTGETRANKDAIKAMGYKYSATKESWYFHTGTFRSKSRGKFSLNDIESKYGKYEYNSNQRYLN
jgi:hypothetical protein